MSKKIINPHQKPKHWLQDNNFSIYFPKVLLIIKALSLTKFRKELKIKPYFIINNNISLNSFNQSILNGLFEMTQGLRYLSILNHTQ